MGQTRPIKIILTTPEYLRLVLQSTEGRRVQDAIAVDLKWRPEISLRRPPRQPLRIKSRVKAVSHCPFVTPPAPPANPILPIFRKSGNNPCSTPPNDQRADPRQPYKTNPDPPRCPHRHPPLRLLLAIVLQCHTHKRRHSHLRPHWRLRLRLFLRRLLVDRRSPIFPDYHIFLIL